MLKNFTFLIFFALSLSQAQVSPITDYFWKLEKIVTVDSTLTVPNDIIFYGDFFSNGYSLGSCNEIVGNLNYDDQNQNFNITFFSVPIEPCDQEDFEAEMIDIFFQEEFFFDIPYTTTLDPFSYSFTDLNDKIYLDITNSEGNVATFYHNLLGQEKFDKHNIIVYPNPSSDFVFIDNLDTKIEHITFYDLSGKLVLKLNEYTTKKVDVSILKSGFYIIEIKSLFGTQQRKFIKR